MAFSYKTFDDEQDDDLVKSLARQESSNRQGLSIAQAFDRQKTEAVDAKIKQDTLENNAEYRREISSARNSRVAGENEERDSRIRDRTDAANERTRVMALAQKLAGDPNAPKDQKDWANAVLLGIKPSVNLTPEKPIVQVPVMRRAEALRRGTVDANTKILDEPAPSSRGEMSPNQILTQERMLNASYMKNTQTERALLASSANLQTSLDVLKTGTGNRDAAAQAILVGYQKMLDPTSVVREGEYARSVEGQGLADRIIALGQRMVEGGPAVRDQNLAAYVAMAQQWTDRARRSAQAERKRIETITRDFPQLSSERILAGADVDVAPASPAAPGPAAPSAAKPKFRLLP